MLTKTTPILMELEEAAYSDGMLEGKVVYDLLNIYVKGDFFRMQYKEKLQLKDSIIFQTAHRTVLAYLK